MKKKVYVKVPYETAEHLAWPDVCPFSGKRPSAHMSVDNRTTCFFFFTVFAHRDYSLRVPASQFRVTSDIALKLLWGIIVFAAVAVPFGNMAHPMLDEDVAIGISLALVPVALVVHFVRKALCAAVRIAYVGPDFLELAFKSERIAAEFCALNKLHMEMKRFSFYER